jgi:hypothetical protein
MMPTLYFFSIIQGVGPWQRFGRALLKAKGKAPAGKKVRQPVFQFENFRFEIGVEARKMAVRSKKKAGEKAARHNRRRRADVKLTRETRRLSTPGA